MAWWRPEEEASPQERIGQTGPSEQPLDSLPVYRERRGLPWRLPLIAVVAVAFVVVMVAPFLFAFNAFDGDDGSGAPFGGSGDGPSLVPPERFGRAMAEVRSRAGPEASLQVLRVAPERIDAIVRRAGGARMNIQVLPDLDVKTFTIGTAGVRERGLSLSRIHPALPERLARRAAERLRAKPGDLNYLALASTSTVGGGGVWSIFFGDGASYAVADLDGSNLRVPGQ